MRPPDNAPTPRAISFDESVKEALARNATAHIAADEIARAEALVVEARAAYLPIVTGNLAYTRLEGDRDVEGRLVSGGQFVQRQRRRDLAARERERLGTQARRAEDQMDVEEVPRLRHPARAGPRHRPRVPPGRRVEAGSSRSSWESAQKVAQGHVDYALARKAGGVGSQLDVVRAEEELADDESHLATARVGLARAREALGILVAGDEALDAAEEPQFPQLPALAEGLAESEKARADVAAARRRLTAADAARDDDWTDYAPILALEGLGFYGTPQIDPLPRFGYQVELAIIVPIYDGGTRTGQERERVSNQLEAREGLDATVRQARSGVRAEHEAMLRASDAVIAARRSADLAARELELVNTGYHAGVSTSLEVIDAERRARDAATDAVIAEDTLREARLDLLAASGRFP